METLVLSPQKGSSYMENLEPGRPCLQRYDAYSGGEHEIQRTMLELLNQLDGFNSRGDVKVILAINRIESLDLALLLWVENSDVSCIDGDEDLEVNGEEINVLYTRGRREEEAKKKIYNVSCERYFGFRCKIDKETSNKLEGFGFTNCMHY